ncbi:transposase [Carnobacterium gallinarum]
MIDFLYCTSTYYFIVIQKLFPNAKTVIDPFHIVQC